jgi:hypothetical protein
MHWQGRPQRCDREETLVKVRSPQDLGAGLLFLLIGAGGFVFGSDLAIGSARDMGPGYFPYIISGLIVLIGIIISGKSLTVDGPAIEGIHFRPIIMLMLALFAFGFLIAPAGVVIASMSLVILAVYAQRNVNFLETIVFAAGVSAFVVTIFVYALGQPMPVWWGN